jgi:hypothetical protein
MISTHPAVPSSIARDAKASPPAAVEEHTLHSERLQIERKTFTLSMRENPRGRFLRITEDVAGRHDTIIVPEPGLKEFLRVLTELACKAGPAEAQGGEAPDGEPVPA